MADPYARFAPGYARHRRPDPRIAALVEDALGAARRVLDVGAGAGSYEPAGRTVAACDPSPRMLAQRPAGSAPAVRAEAEALPVADGAVDATLAVLTPPARPAPPARAGRGAPPEAPGGRGGAAGSRPGGGRRRRGRSARAPRHRGGRRGG